MMSDEIKTFIRENIEKNPADLALKLSKKSGLPVKFITDQIKSRQKARYKLPDWFEDDNLILPPSVSLEQASSQKTAKFKASLIQGERLIDLTGGTGIDSSYFAQAFTEVIFVEKEQHLCELAEHNFNVLGLENITVVCSAAESFISTYTGKSDWIYIDPSRRDERGDRVQELEKATPNVIEIMPQLTNISDQLLIKASPMIDIKQSIDSLANVSQVYVVESDREVKEILFKIEERESESSISVYQLNGGHVLAIQFNRDEEKNAKSAYSEPKCYLYELSPGIMKAGPYKLISERYSIEKLSVSSHLYTSNTLIKDFPGRCFKIMESLPLKHIKGRITKANVLTRNYPSKPDQLKRKYNIKDGGDDYLMFTRDQDSNHICLHCRRL